MRRQAKAGFIGGIIMMIATGYAGVHSRISTLGTDAGPELQAEGLLPRGAALLTSSGNLETTGITAIIHAATGSMTRTGRAFDPTLEAISASIDNALVLAEANGHRRIAIPFLGGGIFLSRLGVSPKELATRIVEAALRARRGREIRFVLWDPKEAELFREVLKDRLGALPSGAVDVVAGSITDFKVHGASAIVNAANMEVQFGGGLSGAIGKASGKAPEIDREASQAIREFYQAKSK